MGIWNRVSEKSLNIKLLDKFFGATVVVLVL